MTRFQLKSVFVFIPVAIFIVSGAISVHATGMSYYLPADTIVVPDMMTGSCAIALYNGLATTSPTTPYAIFGAGYVTGSVSGGMACDGTTGFDLRAYLSGPGRPPGDYTVITGNNSSGNFVDNSSYTYFTWNGGNVVSPIGGPSLSYIVSPLTPLTGPTASSTIPVSFTYLNTGTEGYNEAGAEVTDITSGTIFLSVETSVSGVGFGTSTTAYSIPAGHAFIWRPYLRDSTGTSTTLYGNMIGPIDAVSGSGLVPGTENINANGTTTAFTDFLNIPKLLETRVPFAYFFAVGSLINSLATTTSDFPTLTLTIGATSTPIHISWMILSSSTILMYSGTNNVNTMRDYIGYAMWLALLGMIFFDIRTIHK